MTRLDPTDQRRWHALQRQTQAEREAAYRGWDFSPEPEGKKSALIVIATTIILTSLFLFTPVIVRALINL